MKVTYNIPLANGLSIEMTADEVLKFHDDLTVFINDNYEALTKE